MAGTRALRPAADLEADDIVEAFQVGGAVLPVGNARVVAIARRPVETEVELRTGTGEPLILALPREAAAFLADGPAER